MALYREHAIVLRTYKLGEADRIVVLLTEGRGKVRAVAKGVRKTSSRFGARLEPTSHVALQLYEGRELDTVTQVVSVDQFRSFREDLDRFARASELLEAADLVALDHQENRQLYQLLLGALRTLAVNDSPLVAAGYFLKLLDLEGVRPELDACITCGSSEDLIAFDPVDGGVRCRAHRSGMAVSPEALDVLRDMLGGRLGAVLRLPASNVTKEVEALATRLLEHHVERRLRSASLLDRG